MSHFFRDAETFHRDWRCSVQMCEVIMIWERNEERETSHGSQDLCPPRGASEHTSLSDFAFEVRPRDR